MTGHPLDFSTRRALCAQLGDSAGEQIADLILRMSRRIEELEQTKVSVTRTIPRAGSGLVRESDNRCPG